MKVSVVIPIYNAEKYMRRAVESALEQPETAEVLLVEDASPDNALKICRELENKYARVRLLQHSDQKNHGAGASRNLGIRQTKFDYVAFLDADDYYLKGRFSNAKVLFRQQPDIVGVYEPVGFEFLTDLGRQKWLLKGKKTKAHMVECTNPNNLFEALVKDGKGTIHLNGLTVKKSIFKKSGYFFENLKVHQDTALIVQMAVSGKLIPGRMTAPIAIRTFHDENRILNQKDKRLDKYLYWKTLFNWSLENGLPKKRQILLLNRYVTSVLWSMKSEHFIFSENYDLAISLLCEPSKHPILFMFAVSQIMYDRFRCKTQHCI